MPTSGQNDPEVNGPPHIESTLHIAGGTRVKNYKELLILFSQLNIINAIIGCFYRGVSSGVYLKWNL